MELAFPSEDIPQECFSALPEGYTMRALASSDYNRGFNKVLECLVETPDLGQAAWKARFDAMVAAKGTYFPIVIVSKQTDRIVAMGTVVVELKFFRGLTKVGHVEDIVVDTRLHSKGLGKIVVETVKAIGISKGCSNIILNCSDEKKRKFRSSTENHEHISLLHLEQYTDLRSRSNDSRFVNSNLAVESQILRCYRTAFYEKCGFSYSGLQMAKRLH